MSSVVDTMMASPFDVGRSLSYCANRDFYLEVKFSNNDLLVFPIGKRFFPLRQRKVHFKTNSRNTTDEHKSLAPRGRFCKLHCRKIVRTALNPRRNDPFGVRRVQLKQHSKRAGQEEVVVAARCCRSSVRKVPRVVSADSLQGIVRPFSE